ncbi:MAG: Hint domain-containing protein [Pseudorhodobacter sp.]|nr:Hint domain-containing protein [Pseudorhodobacter sp.]
MIREGALGNHSDLVVSPQHGMLMQYRGAEVLARARHLAQAGTGAVRICKGRRSIGYHHIVLAQHGLIWANGAPSETLYPGRMALQALGSLVQMDLAAHVPVLRPLFAGQADVAQVYGPTVRPFLAKASVGFAKAVKLIAA